MKLESNNSKINQMVSYEEFKKAIAIVKEYQFQVELDFINSKKNLLNVELTVYSHDTKLSDIDMSSSLQKHLRNYNFTMNSTIYEISLISESDFLKIKGFGKQRLKELRKIKGLAGIQ